MRFLRKHNHTITSSFLTLNGVREFLDERRATFRIHEKIYWSTSPCTHTLVGTIKYPRPDVYDEYLYIQDLVSEEIRGQVLEELIECLGGKIENTQTQ